MRQWPTPSAALQNDGESPESFEARRQELKAKGINGNGAGVPLTQAAKTWQTPSVIDSPDCSPNHSPPLGRQALRANGAKCHNGNGLLWQTPRSSAKGPPGSSARHGGQPKGMRLNPCFVEWLMGLPPFWTLPSSTELTASDASGTL